MKEYLHYKHATRDPRAFQCHDCLVSSMKNLKKYDLQIAGRDAWESHGCEDAQVILVVSPCELAYRLQRFGET